MSTDAFRNSAPAFREEAPGPLGRTIRFSLSSFRGSHVHRSAVYNHRAVNNAVNNRLPDNAPLQLVVPLCTWIQSAEHRGFAIASVFHQIQEKGYILIQDVFAGQPFVHNKDFWCSIFLANLEYYGAAEPPVRCGVSHFANEQSGDGCLLRLRRIHAVDLPH